MSSSSSSTRSQIQEIPVSVPSTSAGHASAEAASSSDSLRAEASGSPRYRVFYWNVDTSSSSWAAQKAESMKAAASKALGKGENTDNGKGKDQIGIDNGKGKDQIVIRSHVCQNCRRQTIYRTTNSGKAENAKAAAIKAAGKGKDKGERNFIASLCEDCLNDHIVILNELRLL